jgi:hypothetical protein
MRKVPMTAAENLLEIVMRRHERQFFAYFEPTGGRLGKTARRQGAVTAMLDRLLLRGDVLKSVHGVGTLKQTCLLRKRRSRTT